MLPTKFVSFLVDPWLPEVEVDDEDITSSTYPRPFRLEDSLDEERWMMDVIYSNGGSKYERNCIREKVKMRVEVWDEVWEKGENDMRPHPYL